MHALYDAIAPLLERDHALDDLRRRVAGLGDDPAAGGVLLIDGDAGIGKTSLLRAARAQMQAQADWWWGACEPLIAPLALGPLLDMLAELPPRLADSVRRGLPPGALFAELLALLHQRTRPLVLVMEDLHWADGATLDLLRYLGRRLGGTRVLMVLSWRGSELAEAHPLQAVLAGLGQAKRLELAPLSRAAVAALAARAGRSAQGLFEASNGNPFFVSELLAAPAAALAGGLPSAVRDAVLARVARLSPAARELLDAISVSPTALELPVLDAVCGNEPAALAEVLARDLLQFSGDSLRFAHELTRRVVAASLGPRAPGLHAALFDALSQQPVAPARLVHHAEHAGLAHAVVQLAPQAARAAAQASAHRQAATLYALALSHPTELSAGQALALHVAHANECLLTNQIEAAARSGSQAVALARAAGDAGAEAKHLRLLARIEWTRGQAGAGVVLAQQAIQLLETLAPTGREMAMAVATLAQLHLLGADIRPARAWGAQALARFTALDDLEGQAYALNTLGAALLGSDDEALGQQHLARARRMAEDAGLEELAARASTNLASAALVNGQYAALKALCAEALAYCEARDLDVFSLHLQVRQACGLIAQGRWRDGEAQLAQLAARADLNALQRERLQHLLALQAARRAEPGAQAAWDKLDGLAVQPWFMSVDTHRVEVAWLAGQVERAAALAEAALQGAPQRPDRWRHASLSVWRRRLGRSDILLRPDAPTPLAREAAGQHSAAAEAWAALGNPYEQALALLGGDKAAVQEALLIFIRLGAEAAAQQARQRLRRLGVRAVARGPYRHAQVDPLGLTARERAVFDLLALRLSNREIAARLHRSERTVEHHVATLLAKLGVADRHAAAALNLGTAPPKIG